MAEKKYYGIERRRYVRLDSVFPVQFQLIARGTGEPLSGWLQGFTGNVSKGGISLEIENLPDDASAKLIGKQADLSLLIRIPLSAHPAEAFGRPSWVQHDKLYPGRHTVGVSYLQIDARRNKAIVRYAWGRRLFAPAALSAIVVLALAVVLNSYISVKLISGNLSLVDQLVKIAQDSSVAKQKVKRINNEKQRLQLKLEALEARIKTLEEEPAKTSDEQPGLLSQLAVQKNQLQESLIEVQHRENQVAEDLMHLDRVKLSLQKANIDNMYKWLKNSQSRRTGLISSHWPQEAFVYDQAMTVLSYVYFADFKRAKKILEFFDHASRSSDGVIAGAYDFQTGAVLREKPEAQANLWLGISILQYTWKSKDAAYLKLAEGLAEQGLALSAPDEEELLCLYSFLKMLHILTGKERYAAEQERIRSVLFAYTYEKSDVPFKNKEAVSGPGACLLPIMAIGPQGLELAEISPDRLLEFALHNFGTEADFVRPKGGLIRVKGLSLLRRHKDTPQEEELVYSEATAQAALAMRLLAYYYFPKEMIAKSRSYDFDANELLSGLDSLVVNDPAPEAKGLSCLPYAIGQKEGRNRPKVFNAASTVSPSAMVWMIFAYHGYNPMELSE